MGKAIGRFLNERWKVGARHSLYHKEGTWYHRLTKFPGALFDPNGYVLFKTEAELKESIGVSVTQDVHVAEGLRNLSGYVAVEVQERYVE